ncbi:MAG: DUF192 domain-containing protein [Candidatus Magasanikbacteria bacterium]|nr:DUF192 domain-containing protein [Candidatus Magasanikbacteria bacterium]
MSEKKFKKIHLLFIAVFILSYAGLKLWQLRLPTAEIELRGQKITVWVAKTPKRLFKGLGDRESLAENQGMLLVFGKMGKHGIVMRDMEFPIDIIWLNNGEVVDLAPNVPIEPDVAEEKLTRYYPRKESNTVLELSAGWAEKNGVKIGERIKIIEE